MKNISENYLWEKIVSPYIRKRDLDFSGYGKCISCGKTITYNTCHAGHFVPKSAGKWFKWEEDNIHAQCPTCNCYGSNDTGANYYRNLCHKIGQERVDAILNKRHKHPQDIRNLNEIRDYYKDLTAKL